MRRKSTFMQQILGMERESKRKTRSPHLIVESSLLRHRATRLGDPWMPRLRLKSESTKESVNTRRKQLLGWKHRLGWTLLVVVQTFVLAGGGGGQCRRDIRLNHFFVCSRSFKNETCRGWCTAWRFYFKTNHDIHVSQSFSCVFLSITEQTTLQQRCAGEAS